MQDLCPYASLTRQILPTTGTATSFGFGAQPAASNAFGQAPAAQTFGQPAGSQPTGGFGFGQPQPAASTGFGFGQTQPSGSSGFGQPQTPALGGFGQPQTPALGGFGQPQSAASSGFGQPPSAASSGFGQSQPAASNSFGFNAAPASSGFGFGAPHSSPAMFGQTQPASTSAPSVPAFGVSPGQSAPGDSGCALTTCMSQSVSESLRLSVPTSCWKLPFATHRSSCYALQTARAPFIKHEGIPDVCLSNLNICFQSCLC